MPRPTRTFYFARAFTRRRISYVCAMLACATIAHAQGEPSVLHPDDPNIMENTESGTNERDTPPAVQKAEPSLRENDVDTPPDESSSVPFFSPIVTSVTNNGYARLHADATPSQWLRENRTNRTIHRQYVLTVTRDTTTQRDTKRYELPDVVRIEIDARLMFEQDPLEPDVVYVRIHRIKRNSNNQTLPIAQLVPHQREMLRCKKEHNGRTYCRTAMGNQEMAWPDWAPLELDDWLTSKAVRTGTTWNRTIRAPQLLGWVNRYTTPFQLSFEVVQSEDSATHGLTELQGQLESRGEVAIQGELHRFPVTGTIRAQFDPTQELMQQLVVDWRHGYNVDGVANGQRYSIAQKTTVQVQIASSVEK